MVCGRVLQQVYGAVLTAESCPGEGKAGACQWPVENTPIETTQILLLPSSWALPPPSTAVRSSTVGGLYCSGPHWIASVCGGLTRQIKPLLSNWKKEFKGFELFVSAHECLPDGGLKELFARLQRNWVPNHSAYSLYCMQLAL